MRRYRTAFALNYIHVVLKRDPTARFIFSVRVHVDRATIFLFPLRSEAERFHEFLSLFSFHPVAPLLRRVSRYQDAKYSGTF